MSFNKGVTVVKMYVIFATFAISCAIILACLDHLKMRLARNSFLVLACTLSTYIPVALWGSDLIVLCSQNSPENFVCYAVELFNQGIDFSYMAFASVTLLFTLLALIGSIAVIIVIVHTAKAICKFVQKLKEKQQQPHKHPVKKNFEPKLVHSKIQYKRILYLRLCRLNS